MLKAIEDSIENSITENLSNATLAVRIRLKQLLHEIK